MNKAPENTFLHCQVCDFRAIEKRRAAMSEWTVHAINFKIGVWSILTCPECSHLEIDEIFERYKKRISGGVDENYH